MSAVFAILDQSGQRILQASGDWVVLLLDGAVAPLGEAVRRDGPVDRLDLSKLGRVDTSGTYILLRALKPRGTVAPSHPDFDRLASLVRPAASAAKATGSPTAVPLFERIGRAVIAVGSESNAAMIFIGRMVWALGRTIRHPRRLRMTPLVAVMEQAGIDSIPIVMTMTFFIGAVIAMVGSHLLTNMGIGVYTVELVVAAVLREFGVVIAAILLAGRTASAFAAELGSMRMNQETDALQVMGVDQFDALVVPLMTFCADMGGILGGISVTWGMMDINPVFFAERTLQTVNLTQFWLGIVKAPFLAIIIAASGCRKGLSVGGDVASLGRAVTSAVVQSIFLLIMFDALFAVVFLVLDL